MQPEQLLSRSTDHAVVVPVYSALRFYIGTDVATGHRPHRTATVRGSRADGECELAAIVASVQAVRAVGVLESGRVARGLVRHRLHRGADDNPPNPLGARPPSSPAPGADPCRGRHRGDDRRHLRRQPSRRDRWPYAAPRTLARVHVVLRAAFAQALRWGWVWDNPVERAHRVVTVTRESRPPTCATSWPPRCSTPASRW
jgi:hypothetical protein